MVFMSKTPSPQQDNVSAHLRSVLAGSDPLNAARLQNAVDRLAEAALRSADGGTSDPNAEEPSEEQAEDASQ